MNGSVGSEKNVVYLQPKTTNESFAIRDRKTARGEDELSDEELFEAVKQGDDDALSKLYDRYAGMVHRIARRLICDEQKVQEVVQDVFTRLWTTTAFRPSYGRFEHWLCVVSRRIAIDYLRKEQRHTHISLPDIEFDNNLRESSERTEMEVGRRMLKQDLNRAISDLSEDQQVVLQLAYFQGYSLREIASKLQIPLGTVKTRLHKGLKVLRLTLGNWDKGV